MAEFDPSSVVTRRAVNVFVAMPFVATPTRNQGQLTSFFNNVLKTGIESSQVLKRRYIVRRSDETLNINDQIVRDIFHSDLMICDLSGETANPKVMYELGLRLGLVDKPILLIRENHPQNKNLFDVSGLFTFGYDPLDYSSLSDHIIRRMVEIENGTSLSRSPIYSVLTTEVPLITRLTKSRAVELLYQLQRSIQHFLFNFVHILSMFVKHEGGATLTRSVQYEGIFNYRGFMDAEIQFLLDQSETMKSLPWDKLHCDPFGCPPLDYIIATGYIYDVFPDVIAHDIYQPLQSYRSKFFNSWYMHNLSLGPALSFLISSATIIVLIDRVTLLLVAKHQDEEGILKEFVELTSQYFKVAYNLYPKDAEEGAESKL